MKKSKVFKNQAQKRSSTQKGALVDSDAGTVGARGARGARGATTGPLNIWQIN